MIRRSLLVVLALAPALARANPHALPYSYPYATLAAGEAEVEQYVDLTPVPATDPTGVRGDPVATPFAVLVTEVEYGITDKLEAGLYFQGTSNPALGTGAGIPFSFDGVKQRLRYRIAEPGVLPVDLSVYGELAELSTEVELEAKLNLEKRVGRLQLLVNLWGEREFYYSGRSEWVANPTAGGSFEITPAVHLGLEYWMHAEFAPDIAANAFNPAPHHYVGPALLLQGNKFWWAVAPYVRLDDWSRPGAVGDQYGRFWVRAILGIEL